MSEKVCTDCQVNQSLSLTSIQLIWRNLHHHPMHDEQTRPLCTSHGQKCTAAADKCKHSYASMLHPHCIVCILSTVPATFLSCLIGRAHIWWATTLRPH